MIFPKTVEEYWQLSQEERENLFEKHGFGWRTITEGVWHNHQKPDEKTSKKAGEKTEQIKLDFTE